jgi:hypothetical protein
MVLVHYFRLRFCEEKEGRSAALLKWQNLKKSLFLVVSNVMWVFHKFLYQRYNLFRGMTIDGTISY